MGSAGKRYRASYRLEQHNTSSSVILLEVSAAAEASWGEPSDEVYPPVQILSLDFPTSENNPALTVLGLLAGLGTPLLPGTPCCIGGRFSPG